MSITQEQIDEFAKEWESLKRLVVEDRKRYAEQDEATFLSLKSRMEAALKPEQEARPDFGEPWTWVGHSASDRHGNELMLDSAWSKLLRLRMVACVNALAGCPDPAAFVARAKALKKHARELNDDHWIVTYNGRRWASTLAELCK